MTAVHCHPERKWLIIYVPVAAAEMQHPLHLLFGLQHLGEQEWMNVRGVQFFHTEIPKSTPLLRVALIWRSRPQYIFIVFLEKADLKK